MRKDRWLPVRPRAKGVVWEERGGNNGRAGVDPHESRGNSVDACSTQGVARYWERCHLSWSGQEATKVWQVLLKIQEGGSREPPVEGLGEFPTQEKTLVAHLGAEPLPPRARGAQRPRGDGERGRTKSLGTTGSAQSVAPAHSDIVSSTTLLLSLHYKPPLLLSKAQWKASPVSGAHLRPQTLPEHLRHLTLKNWNPPRPPARTHPDPVGPKPLPVLRWVRNT